MLVRLVLVVGLTLAGVGMLLGLKKARLLGIPPIAFEATGSALLSFYFGNERGIELWFLLLISVAVLVAAISDPYIWLKQGFVNENPRLAKIASCIGNAMLGLIMLSSYLLGAWLA